MSSLEHFAAFHAATGRDARGQGPVSGSARARDFEAGPLFSMMKPAR